MTDKSRGRPARLRGRDAGRFADGEGIYRDSASVAATRGSTPNTDYERAYLTKHEMGHNSNAAHTDAYSKTVGFHVHRSIMHKSAWYHYHNIWSQNEADKMCNYLNTGCQSTARLAILLDPYVTL